MPSFYRIIFAGASVLVASATSETEALFAAWNEVAAKDVHYFSYIFAVASAIHAMVHDLPRGNELSVHIVGASTPEIDLGRQWAGLSKLLPQPPRKVALLLVGLGLRASYHEKKICCGTSPVNMTVTCVTGAYGPAVVKTYGTPDLVIVSNGDCAMCHWFRTLLYLMYLRTRLAFYFYYQQDWNWTRDIMANPARHLSVDELDACDRHRKSKAILKSASEELYRPMENEHQAILRDWLGRAKIVAGKAQSTSRTLMAERVDKQAHPGNTYWLAYVVEANKGLAVESRYICGAKDPSVVELSINKNVSATSMFDQGDL